MQRKCQEVTHISNMKHLLRKAAGSDPTHAKREPMCAANRKALRAGYASPVELISYHHILHILNMEL
jgi:hypothetical protein